MFGLCGKVEGRKEPTGANHKMPRKLCLTIGEQRLGEVTGLTENKSQHLRFCIVSQLKHVLSLRVVSDSASTVIKSVTRIALNLIDTHHISVCIFMTYLEPSFCFHRTVLVLHYVL